MFGVAALGHDQPGQKRSERKAHARQTRQHRRAEADRDDRQQEQFGRARPRDGFEQRRHQLARDQQHDDDQQRRLAQRDQQTQRAALTRSSQRRHEQHHHDDRQILKDEQAQADLADGLVHLPLLGEQLEHDRGRRERDQKARKDRGQDPDAEQKQDADRNACRERNLQSAPAKDEPFDRREFVEAELDADGEQQQDHADLGRRVD